MKESSKLAKILKPNHLKFAQTWINNGNNALQAYIKAYPKVTQTTARVNGSKLLMHADVKAYIDAVKAEMNDRHQFNQRKLIAIREEIATNDNERASDRLTACRDHEKAQGWQAPTKLEVNHNVRLIDVIRGTAHANGETMKNVTDSDNDNDQDAIDTDIIALTVEQILERDAQP